MQSSDPQFRLPPFPAFPSVARYVALGSIADTMSRISRSIDTREGLSLVIGPPGTGKSLVCAMIVDQYRDSHDVVVLGETPIEDKSAFLRHVLHHLSSDFDAIPERDLHLTLIDRVCDPESSAGGLLIVVDEAQSMSIEVLESIRMVTNTMCKGEPRVHAVVCGGVQLDETLSAPSMEAFVQRVATRCYLHPLSSDETRQYIFETITRCGAKPEETITSEAIAAIHHACDGVPRLINYLLTQAIDCAEAANKSLISEHVIDLAWAELQQLPSPMIEEPSLVRDSLPIEFGELDESYYEGHPAVEAHEAAVDIAEAVEYRFDDHEVVANEVTEHAAAEHAAAEHAAAEHAAAEHHVLTSTLVPPNIVLFGDFEEEEDIVVGSGVLPAAAVPSQEPANDLESMLHEEIVNIANTAARQIAAIADVEPEVSAGEGEVATQAVTREEDTNPFQLGTDGNALDGDIETNQDDCQLANDPEIDFVGQPQPVLWLNETADGDQARHDDQDLLICDDQDLLVIEDDIDLTPKSIGARIDSQEHTVSVDFQAMLARMRCGA